MINFFRIASKCSDKVMHKLSMMHTRILNKEESKEPDYNGFQVITNLNASFRQRSRGNIKTSDKRVVTRY